MPTILITGGTGLVGTALTKELAAKGYNVIILTRGPVKQEAPDKNISYAIWDVKSQVMDEHAISKSDFVIHLAGANVAGKRWTKKYKKEITDSRVNSAALLVKYMQKVPNKIKAVISASALGWYGSDPEIPNPEPFKETDPPASDFLGVTCQKWEHAIAPVTALGKRLVILRTGIVLSNKGGAYTEFIKPLKAGIAAIMGSGIQMISWIHIDDLVQIYIRSIENENWSGVFNAVAPQPVSNKRLVMEIAKQSKRASVSIHIPKIFLKLLLGEMSIEVLKSTTVSCNKVEQNGYDHFFPSIESAINNLKYKS